MADERIKDLATQARTVATDDFKEMDGATNGSRKISPFDEHGQFRNALAPRGGMMFDGAQRLNRLLDLGLTGEKRLSITAIFEVTATGAVRTLTQKQDSSSTYSCFILYLTADHKVAFTIQDSPAYPSWITVEALPVGIYIATAAWQNVVGGAADVSIYVNGVEWATTFTANSYDTAFDIDETASQQFCLGAAYNISGTSAFERFHDGSLYGLHIYNLKLTAAEALEIFKAGGLVPRRYRAGNQSVYVSNFAAGSDSWNQSAGTVAGNIDAIGGRDDNLRYHANAVNGAHGAFRSAIAVSTEYRVSMDVYLPSDNTTLKSLWFSLKSGSVDGNEFGGYSRSAKFTTTDTWVTIEGTATSPSSDAGVTIWTGPAGSGNWQYTGADVSTDDRFYVRNVRVRRPGAFAQFNTHGANNGPQWLDESANEHHVLKSSVAALLPNTDADEFRIETPAVVSADGFLLADQVIIPSGFYLADALVVRVSGASTGTITVKETSSGGTTVATGVLASSVKLTLSNEYLTGGKKLHLANSSWSSSTIHVTLTFRRYR